MVLLGLQKDLGTAMVFSAILAGLILLSGISWWIILPVVIAVAVIIGGFLALFITAWQRYLLWFGNGYLSN